MQSELERLRERTRDLEVANEALRQREQTLSTDLETLQQVATQLSNTQGIYGLYERILDSAIAILHADFATIQMFYPERGPTGALRLLAARVRTPFTAAGRAESRNRPSRDGDVVLAGDQR